MADQVTISTFLELRDNLSEGLRNVAKALEGTTVRGRKAIDVQTKSAERAAKEQERIAARQAREQAKAVRAVDAMLREKERDRERTSTELQRTAERRAKDQQKAKIKAERMALSETRALEQIRLQELRTLHRTEQQQERQRYLENQKLARKVMQEFRREQREKQRLNQQVIDAMDRAEARRIRIAERTTERLAREDRKRASNAAAALARQNREIARMQDRMARQALSARKKASKDTVFGHLFGGMTAASVAASAITAVVSRAGAAISNMYQDAVEVGARYEQQISSIAGSIFTQGLTESYSDAKSMTVGLLNTIRNLAARLPGEAQDYVKVFSLSLPTALAKGVTDTQKYAEMVSKYTAIAVQRGYKGQAGYQLNEILEGRVRVTTNMFNVLKPHIRMTAKEFRSITDDSERLRVVFDAINRTAAALPATARDANAIFGELRSQIEWMSIQDKAPLFESMKIAAFHLTELIKSPAMSKFITDISTALGDLTVGAVVVFKYMFEGAYKFVDYVLELLHSIPGFTSVFGEYKNIRKYIDPFSLMMSVGEEERKKWRAQEELDVKRQTALENRRPSTAPSARPIQHFDFRNSRFDIKQEFAEGFDPDRIAVAFSQDLARAGEMRLQSSYAFTGMVP